MVQHGICKMICTWALWILTGTKKSTHIRSDILQNNKINSQRLERINTLQQLAFWALFFGKYYLKHNIVWQQHMKTKKHIMSGVSSKTKQNQLTSVQRRSGSNSRCFRRLWFLVFSVNCGVSGEIGPKSSAGTWRAKAWAEVRLCWWLEI